MGRLAEFVANPWKHPLTPGEWEVGRDAHKMALDEAIRIAHQESTVHGIRRALAALRDDF